MLNPDIPYLTHPGVKLTINNMNYIVIRWTDDKLIHNVTYHVDSNKCIRTMSNKKRDK